MLEYNCPSGTSCVMYRAGSSVSSERIYAHMTVSKMVRKIYPKSLTTKC